MICDCESFVKDKAAFLITVCVFVSGDLRKLQKIRRGQHTVFSMKQVVTLEAKTTVAVVY
jgi:hypothetical protein